MFFNCLILLSIRKLVPLAFTSDEAIVSIAANIVIFTAFTTILDGIQAVAAGILRGAGRPTPGTLCNIVGHYAIGIPLGVVLAFVFKMGVYGLWTGLICGLAVVSLMLVIFVLRIDWPKMCQDAKDRSQPFSKISNDDENLTSSAEMQQFGIGDDDESSNNGGDDADFGESPEKGISKKIGLRSESVQFLLRSEDDNNNTESG